jgi:hypothetical protein
MTQRVMRAGRRERNEAIALCCGSGAGRCHCGHGRRCQGWPNDVIGEGGIARRRAFRLRRHVEPWADPALFGRRLYRREHRLELRPRHQRERARQSFRVHGQNDVAELVRHQQRRPTIVRQRRRRRHIHRDPTPEREPPSRRRAAGPPRSTARDSLERFTRHATSSSIRRCFPARTRWRCTSASSTRSVRLERPRIGCERHDADAGSRAPWIP